MSKRKKKHFQFILWGQSWNGKMWANSPSDARRQFLQDVVGGQESKGDLRVRERDGDKEIVFFDRVFKVGDNRQWPDDMDEFYQWACEAVRKEVKVQYYAQPKENE